MQALFLSGFFAFFAAFGLETVERRLIYFFDKTQVTPAAVNLPEVREFWLQSDQERILTWVALPDPGKPAVVYLHGNAGNLAARAPRYRLIVDQGFGLYALAYRGSSGSSGVPSENGLSRDAQIAWVYATRFFDPDTPLVLYGESLGAAVAINGLLAHGAPTGAYGPRAPDAVVLESAFTSIEDMGRILYPRSQYLFAQLTNRWESLANAHGLTAPLLVLHGTQDELVPSFMGRQIFNAAPAEYKRLIEVPQAGHLDVWRAHVMDYIWHFIEYQRLPENSSR